MTATSRRAIVANIRKDDPNTANKRWPPHRELQEACSGYPLQHAPTCFDPPTYQLPAAMRVDGSLAGSIWRAIDPADESWRDPTKLSEHKFSHYSHNNKYFIDSAFAQALTDLKQLLEVLIDALSATNKRTQPLRDELDRVIDLSNRQSRNEDVVYVNFANVLMQLATTLTLVKRLANIPEWVQDIDQNLQLALHYPVVDPGGYSIELSYWCSIPMQNGQPQAVGGEIIAGISIGHCSSWKSSAGSSPAVYLHATKITTTYWRTNPTQHASGSWCQLQLM